MSSVFCFVSVLYRVVLYIIPQRVFYVNTFLQVFLSFLQQILAIHLALLSFSQNALNNMTKSADDVIIVVLSIIKIVTANFINEEVENVKGT